MISTDKPMAVKCDKTDAEMTLECSSVMIGRDPVLSIILTIASEEFLREMGNSYPIDYVKKDSTCDENSADNEASANHAHDQREV